MTPAGYWVFQFKYHDDSVGVSDARKRFLDAVRKELAAWKDRLASGVRRPDVLLFLTNITATASEKGIRARFARLVQSAGLPMQVDFWDGAKLRLELTRMERGRLLVKASSQYLRTHHVIVVSAEIGNPGSSPTTIRNVTLRVGRHALLQPSDTPSALKLPGASFWGPEPQSIPARTFIRAWWRLPVPTPDLLRQLEGPAPPRMTLRLTLFPRGTIRRVLTLPRLGVDAIDDVASLP
jgi:hypothetical protein